MRIYINESFGNLKDGAVILRHVAEQMDRGVEEEMTPVQWEIELEPHELELLPVERDEPDMPSRM